MTTTCATNKSCSITVLGTNQRNSNNLIEIRVRSYTRDDDDTYKQQDPIQEINELEGRN